MSTKNNIAENSKRLRKKINMSQEDFANEINLSPYYYGKIERGIANPTVTVLDNIANGLKSTVRELVTNVNEVNER